MSRLRAALVMLIAACAGAPPVAEIDTDESDWRNATQMDTLEAYEAYLDKHPRGRYWEEAFERASELGASPEPEPEAGPPAAGEVTAPY